MTSFEQNHLVAVYPDERAAAEARRSLLDLGYEEGSIRIGDVADERASLRGEQRAELDRSVAGPAVGLQTKEMTKGSALATVVGAVVGGLIALPFAAIHMGDLPLWGRIVVVVAAGVLAGATAGYVIGGSLGARGPGDPGTATEGVTVAVASDDRWARDALSAHGPIRIDVVNAANRPMGTVEDESDRRPDHIVDELRTNVDADDYHRHEPGGGEAPGR
jgi:hypothetical protein